MAKGQASYSLSQGNTSSAFSANRNYVNAMSGYEQFMSKRYSATKASGLYTYVLTDIKQGKEKGAGIVGVNMETGEGTRQILFKDKSPDYEVDETTGRIFNLRNPKELTAFVVQ